MYRSSAFHNYLRPLSFFASLALIPLVQAAQPAVSQTPLATGGNIPGSLALVPSVEWPTVLSVANLGSYSSAKTYSGYFDSNKCYLYTYANAGGPSGSSNLDKSWFQPNSTTTNRQCSGARQWSGNFLNWVATPTVDPFRSALTGGARIRDTTSLTVLQKARHDGQNDAGNRLNSNQGLIPQSEIAGATPFAAAWDRLYVRLQGQGFDMLFSYWNDRIGGGGSQGELQSVWTDLNPNDTSGQWNGDALNKDYYPNNNTQQPRYSVYRVRVQVKVCDPNIGLESNCKRYSATNYKPEGLLQQYSDRLRYSVFSYLNDSNSLRDGGVLRANQKFIGPFNPDQTTNNRAEWDNTTGIQSSNPSPLEASNTLGTTGITNSGVLNYLNKFGSMPYDNQNNYRVLKSFDPVSELYYTAIRYFKNQGNVATYSNLTGDAANGYAQADGFPVVTQWDDPITYSCQKNVILGIGDTNTWNDKNLPGGNTSSGGEPAIPAEVTADKTVNVETVTQKVASLEGITINTPFTGRGNSAYIAGLAYDAHTKDQRSDLKGDQTISTYWMDVRENQTLAGRASNQYWLAAKYGGFSVPQSFSSKDATSASISDNLWWTSGDILATGDKRPDNFFVASDAQAMTTSLKKAFAQIASETSTTSTALGASGTELNTGAALFQASFSPKYWSGNLVAQAFNSDGTLSTTSTWSAATKLDAQDLATRSGNIFTIGAPASGSLLATGGLNFNWTSLDDAAKAALRNNGDGTSVSDAEGQRRLAYLQGDRSQETVAVNPLRKRASRLGDIVNSDPLYIGQPDYGYNLLPDAMGGGQKYIDFRTGNASRTPFVAVGANDGMLHVFDGSLGTSGGNELFAYVPRGVLSNLYQLTRQDYSHKYYVDGPAASSDVYYNNAWHTQLVGTTGAGGNSVFALDLPANGQMASANVLWEFSSPDMHYPIQKPAIVALPNGKFGVIVTSGFSDSDVTNGKVWILDASNGQVLKAFTLTTTGGLGAPLAVDLNNDRMADSLYVGDTVGNLWKFDISSTDPNNWQTPTTPLFTATTGSSYGSVPQPITAPLSAALNTDGRAIILFGTGSYYRVSDNIIPAQPRLESFYAIIDRGQTVNRNQLLEQRIIAQGAVGTSQARATSNLALGSGQAGWFMDLIWKAAAGGTGALTGERVIAKASLHGGAVIFTSLTPSSDPCTGGGTSWVMAINALDGSRFNYSYFDLNKDGRLDTSDYLTNGNLSIPASGVLNEGGASKGVFLGNKQTEGTDTICVSQANGGIKCSVIPQGNRTSGRMSWREIRNQ
ncbi:type IV pilus assembly protein PilY1 [Pseudomonas sp. SORGH_AS 211]|uniref:pilus assembly protein n=1 Tax=Pseudomonas sp. SORGH_AS_0211 TaxID=3041796 RepID=UPI00285F63F7|nr:PilC/PilY family type IV pilus protein [Pseudomonas sp. SORGH_AS_0211]MDR6179750.1 type IV pilus assembly protein PilY1 [Pseudomonas sp. SORGH_AS_0211]